MTHPKLTSFKVFPLGFSAFEKSTVETFFRLAARRAPFWEVTERFEDASVVLINAVTRQDIDAVSLKLDPGQRVVLVGTSDFSTGWPVLPRPLRLTALLTCLGAFVSPVELVAPAGVATAVPTGAPGVPQHAAPENVQAPIAVAASPFATVPAAIPVQVPVRPAPASFASPEARFPAVSGLAGVLAKPVMPAPSQSSSLADSAFRIGGSTTAPRPVIAPAAAAAGKVASFANRTIDVFGAASPVASAAPSSARNVLIVDDSDVALKFMQSRLRHFGYESLLARSGEEALVMTANQDFQFVFLDVMMAGLDGYQTCRAIKMNKGRRATVPVVVMLTSRGGTIDKIRGSMSGCDAYLTKPLNEQQLGMVLTQHSAPKTSPKAPVVAGTRPVAATFGARAAQSTPQKLQG